MKTILSFLLVLSLSARAEDPKKLKEMTKSGNRVYVTSDDTKLANIAKDILKNGCWKLETNPDAADFVLKFSGKSVLDYFVYAEVIEPKTGEHLYKTPGSNTVMSVSFSVKKKALKKLIKKHIQPMCDPYFFNDSQAKRTY